MELIKKGKEWYTPERNKMQMLFTKDENVKRVIKEIISEEDINNIEDGNLSIEFEGNHGWDVIIMDINFNKYLNSKDEITDDEYCDADKWYPYIYVGIKVELNDDYPIMLREVKSQIELTEKTNKNKLEENKEQIKYESRELYKDLDSPFVNGCNYHYHSKYCLLVDKLNATLVTRDELKDYFKNERITLIFLDEM
jgi:hypothetical protein